MKTTDSTAQRSDWRNGMRTLLLAAGFALLLGALPSAANAEEKHDPSGEASDQIANCEAVGGEARVSTTRTAEGLIAVSVTCVNSFQDYYCIFTRYGGNCVATSQRLPIAEITAALESGSEQQITAMLADLEAANEGDQGATPDASDDQDTTTGKNHKGKHSKHGKKGGKHRRR